MKYRVAQKPYHFYKVATLVHEKCSGVLAHLYINNDFISGLKVAVAYKLLYQS